MPSELQQAFDDAFPALFDSLGVDVTFSPAGGPDETGRGIFDTSEEARMDARLAGKLWLRIADWSAMPTKRDTFTIESIEYAIANSPERYIDGVGGTFVHLQVK